MVVLHGPCFQTRLTCPAKVAHAVAQLLVAVPVPLAARSTRLGGVQPAAAGQRRSEQHQRQHSQACTAPRASSDRHHQGTKRSDQVIIAAPSSSSSTSWSLPPPPRCPLIWILPLPRPALIWLQWPPQPGTHHTVSIGRMGSSTSRERSITGDFFLHHSLARLLAEVTPVLPSRSHRPPLEPSLPCKCTH